MKATRLTFAGILLAAGLLPGAPALAADNANVDVSATVTAACKFTSGGSVTFTLDPTSSSAATGTGSAPQFWCTKGTTYTVSDDSGLHESTAGAYRMKHAALTEYIPYTLSYTTTGTGTGKTVPITLTLNSSVANGDFVNASAGAYADTVVLSVTP